MRIECKLVFIIIVAVLCLAPAAFAQEDVEGGKDHPLISRMPGFYIAEYIEKEFDSVPFKDEKGQEVNVEGKYYYIDHLVKGGAKAPSDVQIFRNFINALQKIGGKVVYQTPTDLYMKVEKSGMVSCAHIAPYNGGNGYILEIIEKKAMAQDVKADAAAMSEGLKATGHVAVYGINFDADKAEIKPEAEAAIAEIAKLLKQDPSLKLFVVGHTANVGDVAVGLKLSQARAEAVARYLTDKYGIQAARLSSFGAGPYCPVSTNLTEEGRARNRRVELVQR
ncbi:MAG: OmpA family protein [Armatimonadetes bacterium]|nr:OmpA family protein [Armatimonadota bacterium]